MARTVPDRCPSKHLGFTDIGCVTNVLSRNSWGAYRVVINERFFPSR
ncbi:hypothetical protein AB0J81_37480 [Streptomyces bobili]